jgi:hypothetical protein
VESALEIAEPQTFSETEFELMPSRLVIDSGASEEMAITMITSATSLYGEDARSFNANQMRVKISRDSSCPTTRRWSSPVAHAMGEVVERIVEDAGHP